MADSKVEIQVTANADDAKRTFADVEAAANRAMDAGARSADKLAKSLDKVSDSATLSSRQIKALAVGFAGIATGIAATALANSGHEAAAGYLKAGIGGGMGGLTQGLAFGGGKRALIGAAAGGVEGLVNYYLQRQATAEAQKEGTADTAEGLAKAREAMDAAYERTSDFEKLLKTLGETSADATSREQARKDAIEQRTREEADATERMKAAEKAMNDLSESLDGPMTKEQEKYFAKLKEQWGDAAKDLQTARSERKTLEGAKIEKDKPENPNDRVQGEFTSLEKLGIGFNAAADSMQAEGNRIANEQLAVLKQIANVAGNGVVFG